MYIDIFKTDKKEEMFVVARKETILTMDVTGSQMDGTATE